MYYVINTIDLAKEFVAICNKYKGKIFVASDGYIVNGKSLFGVFSLNLTEKVMVTIESDFVEVEDFYNEISKYLIEE